MNVASEPWLGSVRPKPVRISPFISRSEYMSYWALVANSLNRIMKGLLPTIECSVCRSLCRPSPLAARCSRITAMATLEPPLPPHSTGQANFRCPALSARRRASPSSASHSGRGRPFLSKSVLAHSLRWSKKRMLSSCCSNGLISASMKASSSSR